MIAGSCSFVCFCCFIVFLDLDDCYLIDFDCFCYLFYFFVFVCFVFVLFLCEVLFYFFVFKQPTISSAFHAVITYLFKDTFINFIGVNNNKN